VDLGKRAGPRKGYQGNSNPGERLKMAAGPGRGFFGPPGSCLINHWSVEAREGLLEIVRSRAFLRTAQGGNSAAAWKKNGVGRAKRDHPHSSPARPLKKTALILKAMIPWQGRFDFKASLGKKYLIK